MADHILKTWPEYFEAVIDGKKKFELRENDRDYALGDTLWLHEWDPDRKERTGRVALAYVTYMMKGGKFGLPDNLAIMSIELGESE